jgi:hypothetical protein
MPGPYGSRYSAREGRWYGRRRDRPAAPDWYAPGTPDFAERNRQTVTKLPGGLVRVDLGGPAGLSKVTGRAVALPKPVQRVEAEPEPSSPAPPPPHHHPRSAARSRGSLPPVQCTRQLTAETHQ